MPDERVIPQCWSVLRGSKVAGYITESPLLKSPPYILKDLTCPTEFFSTIFINELPSNVLEITDEEEKDAVTALLTNDIVVAAFSYGFYPDTYGDPDRIAE